MSDTTGLDELRRRIEALEGVMQVVLCRIKSQDEGTVSIGANKVSMNRHIMPGNDTRHIILQELDDK